MSEHGRVPTPSSGHRFDMKERAMASLLTAGLLAGCAVPGGEASRSPTPSIRSDGTTGASPAPDPSPTVRIVVETPMPPRESYEDEAAALITKLTGSRCLVLGDSTLVSIDITQYADEVAELPDRTGWLEEPWLWVGSTALLATARGGTLVGEAENDAWIVLTDAAGEPRAESYWAISKVAGDVFWHAKDSVAATPCPPDVDIPQSVPPQSTARPEVHHLAVDIAEFAGRWNAALGDGPIAISEVVVTDSETERSFVPDLPDWLSVYGRAWANDRVRSLQVSAEPEPSGHDPDASLADTRAVFAAVSGIVDPSLTGSEARRVADELEISLLDWHPEDPNPEVHLRSVANGIVYQLTGSGFPAWTLHVYREGDPQADF
jgi:hypothetical protein